MESTPKQLSQTIQQQHEMESQRWATAWHLLFTGVHYFLRIGKFSYFDGRIFVSIRNY